MSNFTTARNCSGDLPSAASQPRKEVEFLTLQHRDIGRGLVTIEKARILPVACPRLAGAPARTSRSSSPAMPSVNSASRPVVEFWTRHEPPAQVDYPFPGGAGNHPRQIDQVRSSCETSRVSVGGTPSSLARSAARLNRSHRFPQSALVRPGRSRDLLDGGGAGRQAGQNAFAESFIGRLRDELLNETLFRSLLCVARSGPVGLPARCHARLLSAGEANYGKHR